MLECLHIPLRLISDMGYCPTRFEFTSVYSEITLWLLSTHLKEALSGRERHKVRTLSGNLKGVLGLCKLFQESHHGWCVHEA